MPFAYFTGILTTGIASIHLNHKRPRSDPHNLYMKKRVINFGDNRLFGGVRRVGTCPYRMGRRNGIGGYPPAYNRLIIII
jgi:hypothetical protein